MTGMAEVGRQKVRRVKLPRGLALLLEFEHTGSVLFVEEDALILLQLILHLGEDLDLERNGARWRIESSPGTSTNP